VAMRLTVKTHRRRIGRSSCLSFVEFGPSHPPKCAIDRGGEVSRANYWVPMAHTFAPRLCRSAHALRCGTWEGPTMRSMILAAAALAGTAQAQVNDNYSLWERMPEVERARYNRGDD
jgi:hypothetical protein